MTRQPPRSPSEQADQPTGSPPVRLQRRANELLKQMSALERGSDLPEVEAARQRLREQASKIGLRLVSLTITEEPIPDPHLNALPRADFERIAVISRDMPTRPQAHVSELERLAARYPHIPMLRNHLAGALQAAGGKQRHRRAAEIIARTAREFPTYVFGFCNHVMMLLSEGRVDEARALVETGPRGPLFTLNDFDPSRGTFHVSEAISHAAMVGQYMLATGRRDAAKVQLKALRQIAPKSPQCRSLAAALARDDAMWSIATALLRLKADVELRAERKKARARKKAKAAKTVATEAAVASSAGGATAVVPSSEKAGERPR